jgi:hypothetical protein
MSDTHIIEVKELEDSTGDLFIEIPPVLLNKLYWKEGDDLKFTTTPAGSIQIRKVKMETVELDFDDDELFKYMQLAHKKGISFNELCNEALEDCLDSNNSHPADYPFNPAHHEQTK